MSELGPEGESRRQMIKRSAVGATALWVAPVVTTVGLSPAAAASGGFCPVPNLSPFDGDLNFQYAGELTAGADLTQSNSSPFSSDDVGFIFNESGPVTIPAGGYESQTGLIPAGTIVCSLYLHASPRTRTERYRATVSLPTGSTIVGYDGREANLQNSDPLFAVPGVTYNGQARSHEWTANAGGTGDYYGQIGASAAEFRMAVANCCVDQGRLFVICP